MDLNNIKGALFDLDGTLVDSLGIWEKVDIDYLRNRGIDNMPEGMFLNLSPATSLRLFLQKEPDSALQLLNRLPKLWAVQLKL